MKNRSFAYNTPITTSRFIFNHHNDDDGRDASYASYVSSTVPEASAYNDYDGHRRNYTHFLCPSKYGCARRNREPDILMQQYIQPVDI